MSQALCLDLELDNCSPDGVKQWDWPLVPEMKVRQGMKSKGRFIQHPHDAKSKVCQASQYF